MRNSLGPVPPAALKRVFLVLRNLLGRSECAGTNIDLPRLFDSPLTRKVFARVRVNGVGRRQKRGKNVLNSCGAHTSADLYESSLQRRKHSLIPKTAIPQHCSLKIRTQ